MSLEYISLALALTALSLVLVLGLVTVFRLYIVNRQLEFLYNRYVEIDGRTGPKPEPMQMRVPGVNERRW